MENMENTNIQNEETTIDEQPRTYTEAEMQSEIDRRVSQALKTQQKKFDKQMSFANLDEQQRREAEKQSRIEELEEQLKGYATEKNRSEIKSVLAARGLPVDFANLIQIGDDIEEAQKSVDAFDKAFKTAVAAEVKRRIASSGPEVGTGADPVTLKGMSLKEQQELFTKNPELYKKLSQH